MQNTMGTRVLEARIQRPGAGKKEYRAGAQARPPRLV